MATPSSVNTVVRPVIPGGVPDHTDTILSGIFIALFLGIGIYFHFRTFTAFGKKFIWSGLCFSYSIARVIALSLRIAVIEHPTSKALNIVAQILIAAGVALLFVVNLQLSRRFFGQLHPHHAVSVKRFVTCATVFIFPVLAMVITTVIQSFTTTDAHTLSIDRTVRLVASVFFVLLPFIPIPIVLLVLLLKAISPGGLSKPELLAEGSVDPECANDVACTQEKPTKANDTAGDNEENDNTAVPTAATSFVSLEKPSDVKFASLTGRTIREGEPESGFGATPVTRAEILKTAAIIVVPAVLMTFEQGVRTAQAFYVPDGGDIPWYMTKAAFWVCVFGMEILAALIFGLAVLPRRFSHLRIV